MARCEAETGASLEISKLSTEHREALFQTRWKVKANIQGCLLISTLKNTQRRGKGGERGRKAGVYNEEQKATPSPDDKGRPMLTPSNSKKSKQKREAWYIGHRRIFLSFFKGNFKFQGWNLDIQCL